MYGLLIEHQTLSGKREEVEGVWQTHMQPAIATNPGHLAYAYSFGQDDDTITAYQVYASKAEAQAFLKHPSYKAYLEASRPLLSGEPKVTALDVRWLKSTSAEA